MPDGIKSTRGRPGVAGALQGISLGGPDDWLGKASMGRVLQACCYRDDTDGYPAGNPSLRFDNWGFWRFRWGVSIGAMSLTIYAKQALNQNPRPSMVLKANSAVGLLVDTPFSAAAGSGWEAITATFTATAAGVVIVELWNNLNTVISAPCLFSGTNFVWWLNGVPMLDNSSTGAAVSSVSTFKVSPRQEQLHTP